MNRGGSNRRGGGTRDSSELWPARATEIWPIGKISMRETNPREHSLDQIEQICASLRKWGWTMPVLIDEAGVLIAGHGRIRAARLMGYQEAPVVVARGWSEEEKRAYVIADNQLAQNSEWNPRRLRDELRTLAVADFDMGLVGFEAGELERLMLDPRELRKADGEEQPTEVTMRRCPTCGGLTRKKGADE